MSFATVKTFTVRAALRTPTILMVVTATMLAIMVTARPTGVPTSGISTHVLTALEDSSNSTTTHKGGVHVWFPLFGKLHSCLSPAWRSLKLPHRESQVQ